MPQWHPEDGGRYINTFAGVVTRDPDTGPAGSLGKKQPNIHYTWGFQNGLWAAPELDDKIVYEVCRIMSEHAKEFVKYHAAGRAITFDSGAKFQIPAKDYHPGAVKYYKEKGFQIGVAK